MMESRKINILGTEYTLTVCSEADEPRLTGVSGCCDETAKELFVETFDEYKEDQSSKKNLVALPRKVMRHEIIHAFLFESGLAENSPWAQNEEMIDFFAIQFPKMLEAFRAADAL